MADYTDKAADKAADKIRDALAVLDKLTAAKHADTGAVTMPNRTEENVSNRRRDVGTAPASAKTVMFSVQQCVALCDEALATEPEPIRTIHHLSCTGGTLFAKCIAALPNVLLLNEVDPLSPLPFNRDKPPFTPTDMIALLRQGDSNIPQQLIERLFIANLQVIQEEMSKTGRSLVLREHSHSLFLTGESVPERSGLRDMIASHFPVRSIVTVRDPIDSYLSMQRHGWHEHFSPSTFEEYCRRYLIFLEKLEGVDIIRYEDFVADPPMVMQRICSALDLDYTDKFEELFDIFHFSGDSGRSGGVIKARPRREMDGAFLDEISRSKYRDELANMLGYKI